MEGLARRRHPFRPRGVEAEAAARNVEPVGPGHHADPRRGHAELVAAAQVGDGAIVADAEGNVVGLTAPASGEYLNETVFLVSPGAASRRRTTCGGAVRRTWPCSPTVSRCSP